MSVLHTKHGVLVPTCIWDGSRLCCLQERH